MPISKRAYSDTEKQEREQKILDAAETLLTQKGFGAINMSEIARTADIAKGTLYLYFQTKEELFLTLFQRKFVSLMEKLRHALSALATPTTKAQVRDTLIAHTIDERQMIRLMALSNIIFEYNISYEKALEYKLLLGQAGTTVGSVIDEKLGLQSGQGVQILYRMYVFIIGMENLANPAPVIQQIYENEKTIEHPEFEDELRELLTMVFDAV